MNKREERVGRPRRPLHPSVAFPFPLASLCWKLCLPCSPRGGASSATPRSERGQDLQGPPPPANTPSPAPSSRRRHLTRLWPSPLPLAMARVLWVQEATRPSRGPPEASPGMFLTKTEKENEPLSADGTARTDILGCWPPCFPLPRGNRCGENEAKREKENKGQSKDQPPGRPPPRGSWHSQCQPNAPGDAARGPGAEGGVGHPQEPLAAVRLSGWGGLRMPVPAWVPAGLPNGTLQLFQPVTHIGDNLNSWELTSQGPLSRT